MRILWVIYERPRDFPESFVLRKWYSKERVDEEAPQGTRNLGDPMMDCDRQCRVSPTLEALRQCLPAGLCRVALHPDDDKKILEVWTSVLEEEL